MEEIKGKKQTGKTLNLAFGHIWNLYIELSFCSTRVKICIKITKYFRLTLVFA